MYHQCVREGHTATAVSNPGPHPPNPTSGLAGELVNWLADIILPSPSNPCCFYSGAALSKTLLPHMGWSD